MQLASESPALSADLSLRKDNNLLAAGVAIVVFAVLSIAGAIASTSFLEGDAVTHYQHARYIQPGLEWNPRTLPFGWGSVVVPEPVFGQGHYMWGVWDRPFVMALFMFPARLGTIDQGAIYVRMVSLTLALICGIATYRVAKGQGHRLPALAMMFLFGGPLFFLHSFSELTEIPFATLLILAFWAYQRKQFFWMALAISLSPLTRPEGFGFVLLALMALVLHRRYWWVPVLFVPMVIWSIAGAYYIGWGGGEHPPLGEMLGRIGEFPWYRWILDRWPYAGNSMYKAGNVFRFVALLPVIVPPLALPALWLGFGRQLRDLPAAWRMVRGKQYASLLWTGRFWQDHAYRCTILAAVFPLMVLVGHSVLYSLGKMASSGEVRYMLAVAPFWAIIGARGWEWAFDRLQWRHALRWAGLAMFAPVIANMFYKVVPQKAGDEAKKSQEILREYMTDSFLHEHYPVLMASPPSIWYYADIDQYAHDPRAHGWGRPAMFACPPGIYMIWDPVYGQSNSSRDMVFTLKEADAAGWVHLKTILIPKGAGTTEPWEVYLSPQDKDGADTRKLLKRYKPATTRSAP